MQETTWKTHRISGDITSALGVSCIADAKFAVDVEHSVLAARRQNGGRKVE